MKAKKTKPTPPKKLPRWRIMRFTGKPGAEYGSVLAPDYESALKKGIEELNIPEEHHSRIGAYRVN